MYKRILVPLALNHQLGWSTLAVARKLKAEDGRIVVVHVVEDVPDFIRQYLPPGHPADIEETIKARIAERIGESKDAEAVVLHGPAGRSIVDYAREIDADCIVLASHKPGLADYFLGSTAARVIRHAACAVHVVRQGNERND